MSCRFKKYNYLFIITTIWLFSCTTEPYQYIEESYENGSPKKVSYYQSESRQVLLSEINYYESGLKKMEGSYKNGERTGTWTYWYHDGKKWSEGEYHNGKENGLKTVWHINGQKYYEGKLENGFRIGSWSFWNKKGQLLRTINYDIKHNGK